MQIVGHFILGSKWTASNGKLPVVPTLRTECSSMLSFTVYATDVNMIRQKMNQTISKTIAVHIRSKRIWYIENNMVQYSIVLYTALQRFRTQGFIW